MVAAGKVTKLFFARPGVTSLQTESSQQFRLPVPAEAPPDLASVCLRHPGAGCGCLTFPALVTSRRCPRSNPIVYGKGKNRPLLIAACPEAVLYSRTSAAELTSPSRCRFFETCFFMREVYPGRTMENSPMRDSHRSESPPSSGITISSCALGDIPQQKLRGCSVDFSIGRLARPRSTSLPSAFSEPENDFRRGLIRRSRAATQANRVREGTNG